MKDIHTYVDNFAAEIPSKTQLHGKQRGHYKQVRACIHKSTAPRTSFNFSRLLGNHFVFYAPNECFARKQRAARSRFKRI